MTQLQKLLLRASEIRTRLAELAGIAEPTDENRSEIAKLRDEYKDVELRSQAATISESGDGDGNTGDGDGDGDGEDIELRSILREANLGRIFATAMAHGRSEGREAELQQHFELDANQVPLAMLERRDVTPAPTNVGQQQAEIVPAVFPQAAAAFLGVDMPTVGMGEAVYPVLTTSATVHTPAENAAAAETTGAFSAEVLSPSRLQASFFFSREDRARFRGMDEALRMNLSDALADGLDLQVLNGPEGLLHGTNLADHDTSAVTSFAQYQSQFAWGRVDGRYVSEVGQVRVVMGQATYAHGGTVYRTANAAGELNAVEKLAQITGGVRVSAHVPAATAEHKQNAIVRLGMRRDMVAPVWEGVTLIPDEITKAANGQIVVTAVMLYAVKIIRSAGFWKQGTQHA